MSIISIRVSDKLLHEIDSKAHAIDVPRAEYIRLAIELMNKEIQNQQRKKQLIKASLLVRDESMKVNEEFSRIEHDPKD